VERKVERAIDSLEELRAEIARIANYHIERIIKNLQDEADIQDKPNIDDMDMSYDFVPYKDNGRRNL
jgi:hypothetical protein